MLDMEGGANITHGLGFKRGSIVSNDGGRDPIAENEMIKDELGHLDTSSKGEGNGFHPLGEIFYGSNDKLVSI